MKTNISILSIALLLCFSLYLLADEQEKHNYKPAAGYVPDAKTAIKIAEAVWLPIYGKEIYNEKPFIAHLENSIWIVEGTLKEGWAGGVALAEIAKDTGCILRVSHGK